MEKKKEKKNIRIHFDYKKVENIINIKEINYREDKYE